MINHNKINLKLKKKLVSFSFGRCLIIIVTHDFGYAKKVKLRDKLPLFDEEEEEECTNKCQVIA